MAVKAWGRNELNTLELQLSNTLELHVYFEIHANYSTSWFFIFVSAVVQLAMSIGSLSSSPVAVHVLRHRSSQTRGPQTCTGSVQLHMGRDGGAVAGKEKQRSKKRSGSSMRCMSQNKKQLGTLQQTVRVNAGDITKMPRTLPNTADSVHWDQTRHKRQGIDNTA